MSLMFCFGRYLPGGETDRARSTSSSVCTDGTFTAAVDAVPTLFFAADPGAEDGRTFYYGGGGVALRTEPFILVVLAFSLEARAESYFVA
jgi:hypothetical protein